MDPGSNEKQLQDTQSHNLIDDHEDCHLPTLRRWHSDSDVSSDSVPPSRDELEQWFHEVNDKEVNDNDSENSKEHALAKIDDGVTLVISEVQGQSLSSGSVASPMANSVEINQITDSVRSPQLDFSQDCSSSTWIPAKPSPSAEDFYNKLALGHQIAKRDNKIDRFNEFLANMNNKGLVRQHIPLDASGRLASVGSIMHGKEPIGSLCKPCIFFINGRLCKDQLCLYCHFFHPNLGQKKSRPSKQIRDRRARAEAKRKIGKPPEQGNEALAHSLWASSSSSPSSEHSREASRDAAPEEMKAEKTKTKKNKDESTNFKKDENMRDPQVHDPKLKNTQSVSSSPKAKKNKAKKHNVISL